MRNRFRAAIPKILLLRNGQGCGGWHSGKIPSRARCRHLARLPKLVLSAAPPISPSLPCSWLANCFSGVCRQGRFFAFLLDPLSACDCPPLMFKWRNADRSPTSPKRGCESHASIRACSHWCLPNTVLSSVTISRVGHRQWPPETSSGTT